METTAHGEDSEGYFKERGRTQIKGLREPLAVYEVLGKDALSKRLGEALDLARAGMGRSSAWWGRQASVNRACSMNSTRAQQGCVVLETFSVSHGKAFPYLPLIDLLRNYFQITAQDDERQYREKATGRLLILYRSLEDQLPYLLYLLGIIVPGSALPTMDSAIRRQLTFEAIARLLVRESQNRPAGEGMRASPARVEPIPPVRVHISE